VGKLSLLHVAVRRRSHSHLATTHDPDSWHFWHPSTALLVAPPNITASALYPHRDCCHMLKR